MPRVGIDCRLAGLNHAGIGRYISCLVPLVVALLEKKADVVLFCATKQQAHELNPNNSAWVKVVETPVKHYSLAEQTQFLTALQRQNLDLLHVPHFNVPFFYRGKFVVTIHDLLWHKQRGLHVTTLNPVMYWLKYFFYTRIVANAVTRAKTIFVPSKTIAHQVLETFSNAKNKVLVTYEGVSSTFAKPKSITQRKKNSLLYVGSLYPHKNIQLVLRLLQQRSEIRLEIVTARSAFVAKVKKQVVALGLETQVAFYISITDHDLAKKYQEATALIQPSLSEGFGLTGLEALQQRTPLLASDIPIFHEIYQQHAVFFDPESVTSLDAAWESIRNKKSHDQPPKNFFKQYSWDNLAKQTTNAYFTALKN